MATASRIGYTFTGWNTQADGSGETIVAPYTYTMPDNITVYAQYVANVYRATFDKQGGTGGSDGVDAVYDSAMPMGSDVTAPTRIGYTFQGYYAQKNGAGTKYYNADMTSAHNWDFAEQTVIYAHWSANTYAVTLNKKGGSGGTSSVNAIYGSVMPSATKPTKTGCTFQGYFSGENGTGVKYYNADMTSANSWNIASATTLYASWDANEYTVILDKQGGSGGSDSVTAKYMSEMPSATAPTKFGYTFKGYYSEANGGGTKYYNDNMTSSHNWNFASGKTLYAYWVGNQYEIIFNKQGGSGGSNSVLVRYGSPMPEGNVTAPTRSGGWTFKGYYDGPNGTGAKYYDGTNMTGVKNWDKNSGATLYAYWEEAIYKITLVLYDGMATSVNVKYGEEIVPSYAPSRSHYEFKGYYSGQNGTGTCYVGSEVGQPYPTTYDYYQIVPKRTGVKWMIEGDGTLYAYWELIRTSYEITVISIGKGNLNSRTVNLTSNQQITLYANTPDGYTFDSWHINGRIYNTENVTYTFELHRSYSTGKLTIFNPDFTGSAINSDGSIILHFQQNECLAEGTMITLADGSQKAVEQLTGDELLLVWNLNTGSFDAAPILFIDYEKEKEYSVINLYFSDGTKVKIIGEHGFWDINLNKYVYFDKENAEQYVGHLFNKQVVDENGAMTWAAVQLTNVVITKEVTTAWSPVTYEHLCYYVNGLLSMPGGISGLFNIFEVDADLMQYDYAAIERDIQEYGLFTYEEFAAMLPVSEEMFEAFSGQYLKIAMGKGLITVERLQYLIERYSVFFE